MVTEIKQITPEQVIEVDNNERYILFYVTQNFANVFGIYRTKSEAEHCIDNTLKYQEDIIKILIIKINIG